MDNIEIMVDDIESRGVGISPEPLLPRTTTNEIPTKNDEKEPKWHLPLHQALSQGDLDSIKHILDDNGEAINGSVGKYKDTPLAFAIRNRLDMTIIEELIKRTVSEELASSSALHLAAKSGNFSAAKMLIQKQPALLNKGDDNGYTPVQLAVRNQQKEMAFYLLKHYSGEQGVGSQTTDTHNIDLINYAIESRMYDFARALLQKNPKLAWDTSLWRILIEECDDFPCRKQLHILESFVYPRIPVNFGTVDENLRHEWEKANIHDFSPSALQSQNHQSSGVNNDSREQAREVLEMFVPSVRVLKLKHLEALQLVKNLCVEIDKNLDKENLYRVIFTSAVKNGMIDIVEEILQIYPDAIKCLDENGNNAFQFAVLHRDEKMFHVLLKWIGEHQNILECVDDRGNNLLHLVANKPQEQQSTFCSREVSRLHQEYQWYQVTKRLLPSNIKFKKNLDGKVPLMIFDKEHQEMLKSETEWLASMGNSCMVAGSLIAAVVFAAAITVPGGLKDDDGLPKFYEDRAFLIFVLSDGLALISSLISVVTFLSIFTSRYSLESYLRDQPSRILIGLLSLFTSLTFMMITFGAIIYFLFPKDHYNWIVYPIIFATLIPVMAFQQLQMPSFLNMMRSYQRSTYKGAYMTQS